MNFKEAYERNHQLVARIDVIEDPGYDISQLVIEAVRLGVQREVSGRLARLEEEVGIAQMLAKDVALLLEHERTRANELSAEVHQLSAQLVGAGVGALPALIRYLGMQVYIGNPVPATAKVERLLTAAKRFAEALGLEVVDDPAAINGSILKRWWFAFRYAVGLVDPETALQEVAQKAKLALELKVIDGPQAEVTAKLAHAGVELLAAMKDMDGPLVMKFGNLLALQAPDADGVMHRLVTELAPLQARWLLDHPELLLKPLELIRWLQANTRPALPEPPTPNN